MLDLARGVRQRMPVPLGWVGFDGGSKPAISFARTPRKDLEDPIPKRPPACPDVEELEIVFSDVGTCPNCFNYAPGFWITNTSHLLDGLFTLTRTAATTWAYTITNGYTVSRYTDSDCTIFDTEIVANLIITVTCDGGIFTVEVGEDGGLLPNPIVSRLNVELDTEYANEVDCTPFGDEAGGNFTLAVA